MLGRLRERQKVAFPNLVRDVLTVAEKHGLVRFTVEPFPLLPQPRCPPELVEHVNMAMWAAYKTSQLAPDDPLATQCLSCARAWTISRMPFAGVAISFLGAEAHRTVALLCVECCSRSMAGAANAALRGMERDFGADPRAARIIMPAGHA